MANLTAPGGEGPPARPSVPAGRTLVLLGPRPGGKRLLAGPVRDGVFVVESAAEFRELAAGERLDPGRRVNSIIVVTRPGDDVTMAGDIYSIAVKYKVLVTTIVVVKSACRSHENTEQLGSLRASSDMVVITSDDDYPQCMVENMA